MHKLGLGRKRDAVLLIPETNRARTKRPLILTLHGAGANGHDAIQPFRRLADSFGLAVLAPDTRGDSWDGVDGTWGPDVDFIDNALQWTFERCAVDKTRIAIAGFSDGASYALSLGLANGDLFSHVVAFSPGFLRTPAMRGTPRIFVSHGAADVVLPSARCSHRIVTQLRHKEYDVHFEEFDGGHSVPAPVAKKAVEWLLAPPTRTPAPVERHL